MQQFIADYGVLAVFLLMAAESACIPIPSELIMLLGGALAAGAVAGSHPGLVAVCVAGVAGNVAGSYLAWAVGRWGGQAALRRWGRYIWLREEDIDRAEHWFARHGAASVFFGRMLPVVRTFISLPAGMANMGAARFGLYTLGGCIPWSCALAAVGFSVGAHWESIANGFHGPTYAIAGLIAALIAFAAVKHARKRRSQIAEGAEPGQGARVTSHARR